METHSGSTQFIKKGNIENVQPGFGGKTFKSIKKHAVPFQPQENKKEEAGMKRPTSKVLDIKKPVGEVSSQHGGRRATDGVKPIKNQVFSSVQAQRKKMVSDPPKPSGTVVPRKSQKLGDISRSTTQKSARKTLPPGSGPTTYSHRPPAKTISAASRHPSTSKPTGASGKAAAGAVDVKPKAPVSSSLTQYRLNFESKEEKKAKLAEWLASKGKTLKRPPMMALPKISSKSAPKPPVAAQVKTSDPTPNVQKAEDIKNVEVKKYEQTPGIIDTPLDLLENSDSDLLDVPQDKVDDIVVNLADALEAMAPFSDDVVKPKTEKVNKITFEEDKAGEGHSNSVSSVIKYSVSTPKSTSVKKTAEGGATKMGNIKAVTFLTPVRRSCRIERSLSSLPPMLADHDPCVSSLAELGKLDNNMFIFRKNTALSKDSPDES